VVFILLRSGPAEPGQFHPWRHHETTARPSATTGAGSLEEQDGSLTRRRGDCPAHDRSVRARRFYGPQLEPDELRQATGLSDDDIVDAVDELEGFGFVRRHVTLASGALGFSSLAPEATLFAALDQHFKGWNPEADALRIAADLVNGSTDGMVSAMAETYGWPPRQMNPALSYLIERDLIDYSKAIGTYPWRTHWIARTHGTRRFVRDRS
jgi:hypothetical protein